MTTSVPTPEALAASLPTESTESPVSPSARPWREEAIHFALEHATDHYYAQCIKLLEDLHAQGLLGVPLPTSWWEIVGWTKNKATEARRVLIAAGVLEKRDGERPGKNGGTFRGRGGMTLTISEGCRAEESGAPITMHEEGGALCPERPVHCDVHCDVHCGVHCDDGPPLSIDTGLAGSTGIPTRNSLGVAETGLACGETGGGGGSSGSHRTSALDEVNHQPVEASAEDARGARLEGGIREWEASVSDVVGEPFRRTLREAMRDHGEGTWAQMLEVREAARAGGLRSPVGLLKKRLNEGRHLVAPPPPLGRCEVCNTRTSELHDVGELLRGHPLFSGKRLLCGDHARSLRDWRSTDDTHQPNHQEACVA